MSPERAEAMRIVRLLRERGRRAAFDLGGRSVGKQFKAADQAGAERAILVGPAEMERRSVRIRLMGTGEEYERPVTELLEDG